MATNPQFPENRDPRHDGRMTLVKEGTRGRNWVPVAIMVAAAALLAAIIAFAPRAPRASAPPTAADVPAQRTGGQLQVTDVKISRLMENGPANITGTLFNNGSNSINAVQAVAIFKAKDGTNLPLVSAPLMGVREGGGTQPFADNPIKPNERRAFQMQIERIPQGWDGSLPRLEFPVITGQEPGGPRSGADTNR
jgi:hypothetical protein